MTESSITSPMTRRIAALSAQLVSSQKTVLRVTLGDGYPSHLSPRVEPTVSGAEGGSDAARLIEHELRALYYERSAGVSVVHTWTEWVRDEWIAKRM